MSVHYKDDQGYTALMHAVENDHLQVAIILLAAGSDVNACNNAGNTSLHLCKSKVAIEILLDYGANPRIQNSSGVSPITLFSNNNEYLRVITSFEE